MMLGLFGSTAIEPTAREAWLSVRGVHDVPPFVVFQTPPYAPPTYRLCPVVSEGSIAIAVMRPEDAPWKKGAGGVSKGSIVEAGPMEVHEVGFAAMPAMACSG